MSDFKPWQKWTAAFSLLGIIGVISVFGFISASKRAAIVEDRNLHHHVYVWQRDWNRHVVNSFHQHRKEFESAIILGAEVSFRKNAEQPQVAWAEIDWDIISKSARPIGVAIRIGAFSGPFEVSSKEFKIIVQTTENLLRKAHSGGVVVNEVHIDFDCAESKLGGYALWVEGLQKRFPGHVITITALPAWLNNRTAFSKLIGNMPRYVLQVHSLEHPEKNKTPFLCDPEQAEKWVRTAAEYRNPFLVALPTYSYLVAEDKEGKFLGIKAEGEWNSKDHPTSDIKVRKLSSPPKGMAQLVSKLNKASPENLKGIIWYRLPVAGDTLNWQWETLACVMAGKPPEISLKAEAANTKPGLYEIVLKNSGSDEYAGPLRVHVIWSNNFLVAGDSLSHFEMHRGNGGSVVFASETNQIFSPNSSTKVGWLRFSQTNEVTLETNFSIP